MPGSPSQPTHPDHRLRPAGGAALRFATAAAFAGRQIPPRGRRAGRQRRRPGTTARWQTPRRIGRGGDFFFFAAGTTGGRILVDLNRSVEVKRVSTYSWHPSTRGPQVYKLYASDDAANDFHARPKPSEDLEKSGGQLVTKVDTRSQGGGQHGVSISDAAGLIGNYR